MTRLAVASATARDLDGLDEILARAEASGSDPEDFSHWDEEFHLHLAECTHNPLLAWIYREINEVRGHSQWNARKDTILTPERIGEYNRQHRRLYDSLRSRDVEASVRAITEHLEKAGPISSGLTVTDPCRRVARPDDRLRTPLSSDYGGACLGGVWDLLEAQLREA